MNPTFLVVPQATRKIRPTDTPSNAWMRILQLLEEVETEWTEQRQTGLELIDAKGTDQEDRLT